MGLPGHRRTSSHKRRRAAHFALEKVTLSTCEKCKAVTRPHHACSVCGFYRGVEVVDTHRDMHRLQHKLKMKQELFVARNPPKREKKAKVEEKPTEEKA